MRSIEKQLLPTIQVVRVVGTYNPQMLAQALGPDSGVPNAWTAIVWASHALQAARYHLYLAHHDRYYYQQSRRPPKTLAGDALASWFFTSFTLHAVAAENHMAISTLLLFKKCRPGRRDFGTSDVIEQLRGDSAFHTDLLRRIRGDDAWNWIREFRRRWFHLNPVRVEELGLQWRVDFDRAFWSANSSAGTLTLPIGAGDPSETTVAEMLEQGRKGFNMFAKQFALYVTGVEDTIRHNWQKWDPLGGLCRLKRPRRQPVRFLKSPGRREANGDR
jgi:hypothetical protein